MDRASSVWILRFEESWFVGVGAGYYARPLHKLEAVKEARRLARKAKMRGDAVDVIEVRGLNGDVIEQIDA
jgi:hypothetical protein